MGVFIYACKLKERVSDLVKNEDEFDAIIKKYEDLDEEVMAIDHKYDPHAIPFVDGIYTYEGGDASVDMSYGGNGDFLDALDDIAEEIDECRPFDVTLDVHGIDWVVSYEFATAMLEEFTKHEKVMKDYLIKRYGEDDGQFYCQCYDNYIKVIKECIEFKRVIRYH